jgi:hypothetical protein
MIPPPKSRFQELLEIPYSYEIGVALFALLAGLANVVRSFRPDRTYLMGTLWIISCTGVLLVTIAKIWSQWRQYEAKQSTHELTGCLHVLHALLCAAATKPVDRLRLTIYVPTRGGTQLEQLLEYVGAKYPGRKKGRRFPSGAGIIGLVFRRALRSRAAEPRLETIRPRTN